jgi:N6-L-threonylcarbamoyladenine synthase
LTIALRRTLGIETSCDETAVAVLAADGSIETELLASQVAAHAPYGGVVPELASREHLRALPLLASRALAEAATPPELVAVTSGPGLVGSLLVGLRYAAALAWGRSLPLIAVDHLEAHLVSPFLDSGGGPALAMPERVLALVASGGHSGWYLLEAGRTQRLSRTRDDAAGESFDKVAQALGLPYPGGPVVDRIARVGDPDAVPLPRPRLRDSRLDFSFSGLKSAAVRWIRDNGIANADPEQPSRQVRDLLASFERAVVDQLLGPLEELVTRYRPALLTASGGVAANTQLRARLAAAAAALGLEVRLPPRRLTTDNAAMVARAGQLAHARGDWSDPRRIDAHPREAWQPPGMRGLSSAAGVV